MKAYLVLVTWPDGTEGLLFPRPGNVPIADTEEKGIHDFLIAQRHLAQYVENRPEFLGTSIRLVEFDRAKVLREVFTTA